MHALTSHDIAIKANSPKLRKPSAPGSRLANRSLSRSQQFWARTPNKSPVKRKKENDTEQLKYYI